MWFEPAEPHLFRGFHHSGELVRSHELALEAHQPIHSPNSIDPEVLPMDSLQLVAEDRVSDTTIRHGSSFRCPITTATGDEPTLSSS